MLIQYHEGKKFDRHNFSETALEKGEYDQCEFTNCDFSNVEFSSYTFTECTFQNCNLSLAKMTHSSFKDARFLQCKIVGFNFSDCNPFLFSVYFENCQLNLSSFYKLKLKGTIFKDCQLNEVDFSEADLTQASFLNCDLTLSVFDRTNLEKADFRSATNYSIDPENNKVKKARFSQNGIQGLLHKYDLVID